MIPFWPRKSDQVKAPPPQGRWLLICGTCGSESPIELTVTDLGSGFSGCCLSCREALEFVDAIDGSAPKRDHYFNMLEYDLEGK